VYSATTHYLDAIKATGSIDGPTVMKELKSKPINDFIIRNGHIQDDGSLVHDMYLYEVKKPSDSKSLWDLYKLVATIPGADAYKRPRGNECPAVKG
jgi:branched-chain amino acid transport system substrate-binding protein